MSVCVQKVELKAGHTLEIFQVNEKALFVIKSKKQYALMNIICLKVHLND